MTGQGVLRVSTWSVQYRRRTVIVIAALLCALLMLAVLGLMLGSYGMSPGRALESLVGRSDDALGSYFVRELRAPRVVAAIIVGAALGVAGGLLQNVTLNPLGSPDLLGFTTGAATGALVEIIVFDGNRAAVALAAVAGGGVTALVVHALTRRGGMTAQRLVLVGLGVGVTLAALNNLLLVRASLVSAQTAGQWLAGSLNAMVWPETLLTLALVLPLLLMAALHIRPVAMLSLGDDRAQASGVDVRRVRVAAVAVTVALVAVATAATGPIAFVALAAPQVARRLMHAPLPGVAGAALTGAVLVLLSDLLAQRLFAPTELAVGVVSGAIGGVYLLWLLAIESRRSR